MVLSTAIIITSCSKFPLTITFYRMQCPGHFKT